MIREATGGLLINPEGFVIYASTQSDTVPAGVFKKRLSEFREIRDGVRVDAGSLGVLYEYPEEMLKAKAYQDPSTWYIPNPNLGASVDVDTIQDLYRKAELDGDSSMNDFLAKHLNVEIGQGLRTDGWAGAKLWPRGIEKGVTLREIVARCEVAAIGIDGGGLDDLLGIGVIGREKGTQRWLGWAHAFVTPEGMDRRKANQTQYEQFRKDGDLTVVERIGDDIVGVIDIVNQVMEAGILYKVGIDPAGIGGIIGALNEIGVYFDEDETDGLLESVKQGIGLMGAIKTIERRLVDGSFRHRGSAMMAWCAGNAIVNATATGMRISRDASGFGKIDPLMAIFNAAYLMQWNPESALSAYEDEDVMI